MDPIPGIHVTADVSALDLNDDESQLLAFDTSADLDSFVDATDTGTDPLVADTDMDGFSDGNEVAAGSDPVDALSTPAPAVPGLET